MSVGIICDALSSRSCQNSPCYRPGDYLRRLRPEAEYLRQSFAHPGPAAYQRAQAVQHDPYLLDDVGPEVVGARPRDYQIPVNEVDRARLAAPRPAFRSRHRKRSSSAQRPSRPQPTPACRHPHILPHPHLSSRRLPPSLRPTQRSLHRNPRRSPANSARRTKRRLRHVGQALA